MSQVTAPRRLSLVLADNLVNHVPMAMSAATETPRLLREWRAAQRPPITQEEAAWELGVKLRSYTRWERGEHLPQRPTVEDLARKMDLDPEDFYPQPEETASETKERIIRIERTVQALADALLSPAQRKRLSASADEVVREQAEAVAEAARKRRSTRTSNPAARRQAQG